MISVLDRRHSQARQFDLAVREARTDVTVFINGPTGSGKSTLLAAGNFAWVRAEYDAFNETIGGVLYSRKGKNPVNIPDRVANLWLTYDLDPSWQIGGDSRYVSSVYADAANTRYAPSYTLFGAFVGYKVDADTRITARVRNLTDEVYARWTSASMLYLGAPRTFELAVQTRF